jgi:hypothetical protein
MREKGGSGGGSCLKFKVFDDVALGGNVRWLLDLSMSRCVAWTSTGCGLGLGGRQRLDKRNVGEEKLHQVGVFE